MSTEIADAYIALYTKMPGAQKDIEKHLGDAAPGADAAGKTIGDRLIGGMGSVLKGGAIAVAGLAIAALGTAMVKGFQRLDALDQAEAKLRGLGHSAENVELIMNDALASVKGTAFGMGDAATVAAATVAAGVQPGEDLQRTLKLVADAATIAGVDMSTMGSIINKVATSDMMQMDVANQLMDAGIPILQMVGEQMGVTAEEARAMASAGEVSFETFQSALEAGLGGAALESGNTFSGAMDNVMAALGRIGEALLGGVFENLKGGFGDLNELLDDLQPAFADIGSVIGDLAAAAIPALIDAMRTMAELGLAAINWIRENIDLLRNLGVAVGVAVAAYLGFRAVMGVIKGVQAAIAVATAAQAAYTAASYGAAGATYANVAATGAQRVAVMAGVAAQKVATAAQWAWNAALSANPIAIIVIAIAALVAALVWFFTQTELGQKIWQGFIDAIAVAWNWLYESVIQPVAEWIGTALTAVGEFFTWLWTEAIQPALQAIGDFFTWIYDYIIMPVIVGIMTYVGLWAALFQWLWEAVIQPVLQWIGDLFSWLWTNAIQPAIDWISGALEAVGAVFAWLWENAVQPAFQAIGDFFGWLWTSVVSFYSNQIQSAIDAVGAIFTWLYQNAIKPAFDGISTAFNWVYNNVVKPVANWISSAIEAVGTTVQNVFGGIADFIRDAFNKAVDVVKRPLNALIDLVNGAISGINSIRVDIPDWVPVVGGTTFSPSIPSIPRLAEGGIVAARPGGIIANIGEGRYDEAVVPLNERFWEAIEGRDQRGPQILHFYDTDGALIARLQAESRRVLAGEVRRSDRGSKELF